MQTSILLDLHYSFSSTFREDSIIGQRQFFFLDFFLMEYLSFYTKNNIEMKSPRKEILQAWCTEVNMSIPEEDPSRGGPVLPDLCFVPLSCRVEAGDLRKRHDLWIETEYSCLRSGVVGPELLLQG